MTLNDGNLQSGLPALQPPPAPLAPLDAQSAGGMVKLSAAVVDEMNLKVEQFVAVVMQEAVRSEAFQSRVNDVHALASSEIRESANLANRMLEKPMRSMNAGLFDETSSISRSLLDLRNQVQDLDPARQGNLLEPRKLLGLIPWGSKIQDYFQQYQSAQSHLKAILEALHNGQDELRKDNAAIAEESANAWQIMERLEQFVYVGKQIDVSLSAKLDSMQAADPEKARIVREELLFYVRQKVQDLLTQLAVNIQGYLALDMIRKNNLELIKGVDRASTTTVAALRTAVIVAQALANQKLVLDQISALNTTTGNLIASTSSMLKSQAGQIHEQASGSLLDLDKLKLAFQNIYDSMDMVATYKLQALASMQQTVEVLTQEVGKSRTYVDRVRGEKIRDVTASLDSLPPPAAPG
jgi:uncharacterized protein YaaN involved in tellurite resistance